MRKLYLFVYNNNLGDRQEIANMLNGFEEIIDWRYDLPNCFYLVSEKTADQLTDLILNVSKDNKQGFRFFISEIPATNRQGWLPNSTWDFMKNLDPSTSDKKDKT